MFFSKKLIFSFIIIFSILIQKIDNKVIYVNKNGELSENQYARSSLFRVPKICPPGFKLDRMKNCRRQFIWK